MNSKSVDFVNVSVRIKPSLKEASCLQVINNDPPVLLVLDKSQLYHFDNIFTTEVKQNEVYNETVKPLVENVKNGYNCTVFAYGQTGTGKTYTMGTNPDRKYGEDMGLISRTLEDFFSLANEDEETEIFISFIEIYNEKVFDLLSPNKVPLSVKGFTVHGFEKIRVYDTYNALLLLTTGGRNRHTGETKQNFNSSRSHAVFTVYCRMRNSETEIEAKLNLVDLAGSESVRKTGNQGSSLNEGININKGLLSLGQVMTALSNNSAHIPYRQSVITTILQDSLNKKNYVSLIACVSPNVEDLGETLQTLEFSQRVKKMKNKPEISHFITQYKKDNFTTRGQQPFKRTNDQMYETPFKKTRNFLPAIVEPAVNSELESPKYLLSSSVSSSVGDQAQQNFSPVIKKYINAMEHSLMNKLEDVIKNTLRRSTRISSFNKENISTPSTPSFSWAKVSNIVRSEILQFTSKIPTTRSSPLNVPSDENGIPSDNNSVYGFKPRKLIADNTDTSCFEEIDTLNMEDEGLFKVPAPVQQRKKPPTKQSPVKQRRSIRLQAKNQEENVNTRRSIRLQVKYASIKDDESNDVRETSRSKKKNQKSKDNNRPINSMSKTKLKGQRSNSKNLTHGTSPITARTRQVLQILNNGDIREIATLHTVGAKTAEKIYLFRQLKGGFNSIAELSNMPYWTKNKYQKFLSENFLRG